jgi:hypothetical protein
MKAGRPRKLENLSLLELKAMQVMVERAKIIKREDERKSVRDAIAKLANEAGFSVKDILR